MAADPQLQAYEGERILYMAFVLHRSMTMAWVFPDGATDATERILHRWLNRKSQRKAHNRDPYNDVLRHVQGPRAQIRIDLNSFRRAEAC